MDYDSWVLQSHDVLASARTEKHSQDVLNWAHSSPSASAKSSSPAPPPPPQSVTPSTSDGNTPDVPEFSDLPTSPQYYSYPPSYYPQSFPSNGSYAQPSWQQQQQQQHQQQQQRPTLALSNYSTLNGATSSNHPPQGTMSPQPMVIDPALTTTNGATHNPSGSVPYPYYTRPSHTSYQPSPLSINPSFMHDPGFFQSLQAAAQAQGVNSPQLFHALPPSMLSNLTSDPNSASSISSTASPIASSPTTTQQHIRPADSLQPVPYSKPILSPEEKRAQFLTSLKPLLVSTSFTGGGAVQSLVNKIEAYGVQEVDAETRKDILTKIRDGAGNHYFRAFSENTDALEITREWVKAGAMAKQDSKMVETIMPLLHVLDRLPFTIDNLRASRLGKPIAKIAKEQPNPAIKDMALNLETRWRNLAKAAATTSKVETNDDRTKRRKLDDGPSSTAPGKSAAGSKASSSTTQKSFAPAPVVKKEVVTAGAKGAKTDSSFFSAKSKPKLPSFKKAPPIKMEANGSNVAQPSAIDPFQEALKSMGKRKESPAASITPPQISQAMPPSPGLAGTKRKANRKSVKWAPESSLVAVKLIERAVYDDDDGVHGGHTLRDLDRDEGAALHKHLFEEVVDWSEPIPLEMPSGLEIRERGTQSVEKGAQVDREQTALSAVYMTDSQIPDSPAEPTTGVTVADDELDKDVKTMITGQEVDSVFWSGPATVPMGATVADLVGQLNAGSVDMPADPNILSAMQSMPPDQIQQLVAQLTQPGSMFASLLGGGAVPGQQHQQYPSAGYGADQSQFGDYSQSHHQPNGDWSADTGGGYHRGGGRGRGRGRGRGGGADGFRHSRRKPCMFFQAGRCKYGDQCDFSHEL